MLHCRPNFDTLIEQSAQHRKIAMRGALNGHEARQFTDDASPLVKFHGCHMRNREKTLWTTAQLGDADVVDHITTCSNWMKLELPGKDLVVIGFWTDCGYLNDVLADALDVTGFSSVTVINPEPTAALQTKAPTLWARLSGGTANFKHIQASGADALPELRAAFSKVWLKKFYPLGKPMLEADGKTYAAIEPDMTREDLYKSRCDAEGRPYNQAAKTKAPPSSAAAAAFFHLLLLQAHAARSGSFYEVGGKRVRVVQGSGELLNTVRERYREPPALLEPDVVVCAGAVDSGAPGKIIPSGVGASILRPHAGGGARWMTSEQARGELGI